MHKKLHKKLHNNLHLKRNKKKNYRPINNKSIISIDKLDSNVVEKFSTIDKKNKYLLPTFSSLIISGLIIFGYSFFSSQSESDISLLSVEPKNTISLI